MALFQPTKREGQSQQIIIILPAFERGEERHEYAVLELACDHPGEIRALCQIAHPSIGVLTNISPAQLQYFGTVEHLASELGTLLTALPNEGAAIVNTDDVLIRDVIIHIGERLVAPIKTFQPSMVQNMNVTWEGVRADLPIVGDKEGWQAGKESGDHEGRPKVPLTLHVESRWL